MTMSKTETLIPTLLWAQDKERVYATINVSDLDQANVKFGDSQLIFTGSKTERSGDEKEYEMTVELAEGIDVTQCNWAKRARNVQIVMAKKEEGTSWKNFAKDAKKWKQHISVDWNKWVDSDDEAEDVPGRFDDMKDLMGGGGMGGMGGGMGGGMDFASMMKAGGMGGGMDMGPGDDDAPDSDDDDDMPELEETPVST